MKAQSIQQAKQVVAAGFFARVIVDTLVQIFYAFLPIFAAGIGVTPILFGRLLSVRSVGGIFTPLFGNLAEWRGYRVTLPAIMLCGAIGAFLLTTSSRLSMLIVAIFIMGMGISTFPFLLAGYSSGALPASFRARGMSIIEYGWAISSLVGVYVVGQLLERSSWQVPLLGLGVLMFLMAAIFFQLLRRRPDADDTPPISLREQFHITENRRGAYAGIAIQGLIIFSALHFFISYSLWLTNQYQFTAVQLSTVAMGFGVVDLIGSGLVSIILDRLGRKRALVLGGGVAGVAFLSLGWVNNWGLLSALVLFFLGRLAFEFTVVTGLINASEQSPNQRSRVMSMVGVVGTLCQSLASMTGPVAIAKWGLSGLTLPSAIGFLLIGLLSWKFVPEGVQSDTN